MIVYAFFFQGTSIYIFCLGKLLLKLSMRQQIFVNLKHQIQMNVNHVAVVMIINLIAHGKNMLLNMDMKLLINFIQEAVIVAWDLINIRVHVKFIKISKKKSKILELMLSNNLRKRKQILVMQEYLNNFSKMDLMKQN